jgi:broad specificity phosphatase PhoE
MRWLGCVALLLAALAAQPEAAPGPGQPLPDTAVTTVILVRHAEKNTEWAGADQPLSAAGMLRAQELAHVLGKTELAAIYVTRWARSRQTAEPLARRLGDSLTVVDSIDATVRGVLGHRGSTVLVVGHGDTVPQILGRLMGDARLESLEVDFDDLFVVTLDPRRPPRLLRMRYGATPASAH